MEDKCIFKAEESKASLEKSTYKKDDEDDNLARKAQMNMSDDHEIVTIYKTRFCKTCFINRPPMSSHCRFCD